MIVANNQTNIFPDCKSGSLTSLPISDYSQPARQRAADLWWSEALHSVVARKIVGGVSEPTSFPIPLNLDATFNLNLIHRIAKVIFTEARACNNENITGLNFFTPNINIFRDPRWGRGQETPGEDPFLISQYVYTMIQSLQQGEDGRYLKISTTCKHHDAYDLESWNGTDRWHFDAKVTDQDLVETYLPPFETCIRDVQAAGIMCSLNAINGIPACAHQFLLQTITRDTFHFDGYIVSDCGGVSGIMTKRNYTSTVEDTVAAVLHGVVDLDCSNFYHVHVQEALNKKTIIEEDIDQALIHTFTILIRLGYFDPPEEQLYRNLSRININTVEVNIRSSFIK